MKHTFSIILVIASAIIMSLSFTNCDEEEDLYGTWKQIEALDHLKARYIHFSEGGNLYVYSEYDDHTYELETFSYIYEDKHLYAHNDTYQNIKMIFSIHRNKLYLSWFGEFNYTRCYNQTPLDDLLNNRHKTRSQRN